MNMEKEIKCTNLGINVGRAHAGATEKKITDLRLNQTIRDENLVIRRIVGGWHYEYYSGMRMEAGCLVRDVVKVIQVKEEGGIVCGHPANKVYLYDGYYYCDECKGRWKSLAE